MTDVLERYLEMPAPEGWVKGEFRRPQKGERWMMDNGRPSSATSYSPGDKWEGKRFILWEADPPPEATLYPTSFEAVLGHDSERNEIGWYLT